MTRAMGRIGLAALVLLAACGYRLPGGDGLPEGAKTVSIKLFTNRTRENGLEVRLRRAIDDEFRRRGTLRVVEDEGDLVLSGDIKSLTNVPVAFSATDEAVQYQSVIVVGMRLTERGTGRVVRENRALRESEDFGAVSGVVITSSPHFQRGTLDGRDLVNLTNVQLGESRRREATRNLLDQVAGSVYRYAVEGF